jgi:hypothetical protein
MGARDYTASPSASPPFVCAQVDHSREIRPVPLTRPTLLHQRDIFAFIEGFYNRTRLHSAIGYIAPTEMELRAEPIKPVLFRGGGSRRLSGENP